MKPLPFSNLRQVAATRFVDPEVLQSGFVLFLSGEF